MKLEEWLVKFGFKKEREYFILKLNEYENYIYFYPNTNTIFLGGSDSMTDTQGFSIKNIKTIEHLQFIIFTLTR